MRGKTDKISGSSPASTAISAVPGYSLAHADPRQEPAPSTAVTVEPARSVKTHRMQGVVQVRIGLAEFPGRTPPTTG